MNKLKVMTVLGTRPEIIRLSAVIKACDAYFDHVFVHTGQNWDPTLNDIFFDDLQLRKPDHYLNVVGQHLGETIGNVIARSYELMERERPDAVLLLGDTNSALSAIAAKRLKIPIFHMEAGNRCFDQNVPEETNRRIVDHISDVNLPYTEHSRRYLLAEGIRKEHIFVTGSPMTEVIRDYQKAIDERDIVDKLGLERNKYFVLSAHREENLDIDNQLFSLMSAVNEVAEQFGLPIIYTAHPRSLKKLQAKQIALHPLVRIHQPFGFLDYNHLQQHAYCVLSDSGTLSEESAILNFPGVLIRTSTERPEVLDKGTIVIGGVTGEHLVKSITLAVGIHAQETSSLPSPPDYVDTNVSNKVVKLIQSYTPIINKVIWNK
ncbi:non-hydrolyzing UDP-N-acetylglucosamine 2-epimerase [Paenibacillus harenae]|uniref:UDP-N-acetylglucosamine 2-epimerase (Non-hydrolyzing) n=1 Tax=Paenibacillus harenae TaxID=306543 RepID=A0ABT9U426_PAEHA|nr:UDP-N-acetylglucosamine 2-epimerase (non-hydrolyzing) [Paenibacillus harenae]MDQ0114394.1 UDP-N-acetylglucosamine 2-epimerase (non-hydrolyzing) [Paenibacillus harenae]